MIKFTLILLSFCIIAFGETEFAEPKPSFDNPRKIVFGISDGTPHSLDHLLSVANNVLKFYGPENVMMKIVAYSQGMKLLNKNNPVTAVRVDALIQYEVEFVACGNTMRTLKIKEEDLVEGSVIVTAGVVELIESIKNDWTYINP
ncbi:DsrE family protein [Sulfurimonas sp.]|jgi:uncharacterized protein|uniref:DsrE family protein n=1 Tax=Sulfurimonas sp. TaxID=2022749 RepID=UPI0025DCA90A|nr:DsrE family protein [Sulfurimonas sp.]MBT5935788.1 hypothetical protein [Sulfurimonas sp.]